jgi:uncharacterized protein YuzE
MFEISISGRDDGTIEAMYISVADGKIAKTKEIEEDALLADFDSRGRLLGLEVLAPVKISDLLKQVKTPTKKAFKRFIQYTAPSELVLT